MTPKTSSRPREMKIQLRYVDISDSRRPDRSGRMIPLTELLAFVSRVRNEPDAAELIVQALEQLACAR